MIKGKHYAALERKGLLLLNQTEMDLDDPRKETPITDPETGKVDWGRVDDWSAPELYEVKRQAFEAIAPELKALHTKIQSLYSDQKEILSHIKGYSPSNLVKIPVSAWEQ